MSESHGVNGRVPVLKVRPRAPVLPSAPPLALSTRIREPAHDMHLHSLATDCRAYRCPLADERCPGLCSLLDHIPTDTHAVVEHTLDKGNTHLSWDIHQTRDNYSSLDM